jgi:hypothetical protein
VRVYILYDIDTDNGSKALDVGTSVPYSASGYGQSLQYSYRSWLEAR